MSNYGFATYDEKKKNRLQGVVNSKWPIFGPKYSDIKHAFKTVHITDTYQQDFVVGPNVRVPDPQGGSQGTGYSTSIERGVIRQLVATIPHGYGFRPLGYIQFSGTIQQNTRCKWKYDSVVDYAGNWLPSLAPIYGNSNKPVDYISNPALIFPIEGSSYVPGYGSFSVAYPPTGYGGVYYYLTNPNGLWIVDALDPNYKGFMPYEVEIDEENVYIYRNTYWLDQIGRFYQWDTYYQLIRTDQRARSQGVMDWAGSSIDLTIYLCPYKLEDLLPKEYVDEDEPSDIGVFDRDNWDGGKVYG